MFSGGFLGKNNSPRKPLRRPCGQQQTMECPAEINGCRCQGPSASTCVRVSQVRSVSNGLELTLVSSWPEHYHCPFRRSRETLWRTRYLRHWGWRQSTGHSPPWNFEAQVLWPEMSLPGTKWAAPLCDLQSQQTAHHTILTSLQSNVHLLFDDYIHSEFFLKTFKCFVFVLISPLYFNSFIQSIFWTRLIKCFCALII